MPPKAVRLTKQSNCMQPGEEICGVPRLLAQLIDLRKKGKVTFLAVQLSYCHHLRRSNSWSHIVWLQPKITSVLTPAAVLWWALSNAPVQPLSIGYGRVDWQHWQHWLEALCARKDKCWNIAAWFWFTLYHNITDLLFLIQPRKVFIWRCVHNIPVRMVDHDCILLSVSY